MQLNTQVEMPIPNKRSNRKIKGSDFSEGDQSFGREFEQAYHQHKDSLSSQTLQQEENASRFTSLTHPAFTTAINKSSNGPFTASKPKRKQKEHQSK